MKNSFKIFIGFLFTLSIVSCEYESFESSEDQIKTDPEIQKLKISAVGDTIVPFVTDLIVGQNKVAGTVSVNADGNNIYVTYETYAGWVLNATHLFVGNCDEIPVNGGGNPKIGRFPYKNEYDQPVKSCTYTIDLSSLEGNCFCLAAHAEVDCDNDNNTSGEETIAPDTNETKQLPEEGNTCSEETAWGQGNSFSGRSWAMFTEFCIETEIDT